MVITALSGLYHIKFGCLANIFPHSLLMYSSKNRKENQRWRSSLNEGRIQIPSVKHYMIDLGAGLAGCLGFLSTCDGLHFTFFKAFMWGKLWKSITRGSTLASFKGHIATAPKGIRVLYGLSVTFGTEVFITTHIGCKRNCWFPRGSASYGHLSLYHHNGPHGN